jgi:DNA polymerase III delta prime subunit
LTCNYVERIIDPIQSRCQSFQIVPPDRKQVAQHLSNILDNENVKYKLENIVTIVNGGFPDLRRVINASQRQVVNGELVIDEGMSIQNDYKNQVLEILKTQDKKNSFKNIRQLLADSKVTDFSDLFRLLFDTVDDWGRGHVAECILLLAQYQQSDAVVVDKEINIMAMFTEIIGKVK